MVEYGTEGRCYIVDCGIMDTDPVPWPAVTPEELAQADFLFLTHCHKDHASIRQFCGTGIPRMACDIAGNAALVGNRL